MKVFIQAVIICSVIMFSALAMPGTPYDGDYYFGQMKNSILEILTENQKLINTGPGGALKTEKLKPEAVYRKVYAMFKKIAGKDFKLSQLKGETDPGKIAPILAALLQAGRVTIAKAQKDINKETDGSVKLKKIYPRHIWQAHHSSIY